MATELRRSYAELGLKYGASLPEVRRAFLNIARRFHPDKCDAPEAAARFRRARAAVEHINGRGTRPSNACESDSDDSVGWEPPPPPAPKPAPVEEPEDSDDMPSLAEMLNAIASNTDDNAKTTAFRRRFLKTGIMWPWNSTKTTLRLELLQLVRDELDRRIHLRMWSQLAKDDLLCWLDAHGVSLQMAREDDSVDREMLQRLVLQLFATGDKIEPTPIPQLSQGSMSARPEHAQVSEHSRPHKRVKTSSSPTWKANPDRSAAFSEKARVPMATVADCKQWLQAAQKRGNGKKGSEILLREAAAGNVFRGKRLAMEPLRAAIACLGC